ncbi:phosphate/phosphite/phosphonate ABC transporter substrate-binding protein [Actomonas aquatica]|uniref:PhnD/SsuA/transferrin family substrate-binding protein n=1 Tax=Actomonas aquatica TaxID=2866162 RepID=A0ABZ1CFK4_9BACT|nr:PhnD/SsuA/transferrin family substrate-binding protein [Opitutus sp. WL0086]WRQ90125.1 PhnD/SsuA/transferrin family substrate-binding protein [Opitutus sp. WL0086]
MLSCLALSTRADELAPAPPPTPFRVGFSASLFEVINAQDARAAVKSWSYAITAENDLSIQPDAEIIADLTTLTTALQSGTLEAAGLTTDDFFALREAVELSHLFVTQTAGQTHEEYVILVRRDQGITSLAELQDHDLLVHQSPRLCLALPWLDRTLHDQDLPSAPSFFDHLIPHPKLTQVVLPVFFGRATACLLTRRDFETMAELNPQLGRQLVAVASSPPYIPAVMALRADFNSPELPGILAALRTLHQSPSGQQVLLIFQGEALVPCLPADLEPSLELLRAATELR